jgi:hypothetical protein
MAINPIKTPFAKMSFTPDIPAAALGPNEYNIGLNVETDVRGIKKVYGEIPILSQIPSEPIYITGGFRSSGNFWYVVGCLDGNWFGLTDTNITVLTPGATTYIDNQYTHNTAITANWNGDVLFINDTINPPMYLLPTNNEIRLYDYPYMDQTPNTYTWNYSTATGWTNLVAGFQRIYSSPNVGSVLVAGNLSYDISATTYNAPNTIRWSQSFGLNSGPTTWEPTLSNTANEVDVPVRGPLLDGFAINGNFYMFSYWDCCVLTPIAYTSTAAPVFGVSPVTQNRGILNENCFAINDSIVFGVDSSDIWTLEGGQFREIGNQRVKNWFYDNLDPQYYSQVFMVNNTRRNQIEIYFPDTTTITGRCNKMISYRYDLDCWNPPRDVREACSACEGPIYDTVTGDFQISNRTVVYTAATTNTNIIQKDQGNAFYNGSTSTAINSYFQRDNISFGEPYSNKVQTHRIFPEVIGTGTITISVGGALSAGQTPTLKTTSTMAIQTDYPWIQPNQNAWRMTTVKLGSNDSTATWLCTQANWQVTIVEDDR